MYLLSNRVLHLFLLRVDGEINGEIWELKVTNEGERDEYFSVLGRTGRFRGRRETLERKGKGINTPSPQRSLKSLGVALSHKARQQE